jgi:hypothetical protein
LLLRASGAISGRDVDVQAVTDDTAAAGSGVPYAALLLAFAEGVAGADDAALARARGAVLEALGPAALVDAAAVASNFERMVRVADATGTPLDPPLVMMTDGLRAALDLDRYAAATNTPPPTRLARAAGPVVRTLVFAGLRLVGRWRRG